MEKAKKKILITGISGMLGRDLYSVLKNDYDIFGMDLNPFPGMEKFLLADITLKDQVKDLILKVRPELVIHTAAYTNVDACETEIETCDRINVTGTQNVALACSEAKSRLIHISTDYVFPGCGKIPYREADPIGPLNQYGRAKLAAELIIPECLKQYLIVRTSWLFGFYGRNFVSTIINKAQEEKKLQVVNDQIGSPTYTVSLAQALRRLSQMFLSADSLASGVFHVTNSGTCSWYDFAAEILKQSGSKTLLEPVSSDKFKRPAQRPAFSVLDNSKYEQTTADKLCPWPRALSDYLKLLHPKA